MLRIRLMNILFFIFLSFGFLTTSFSFADVFTYQLKGFPKESAACYEQVGSVAEQFENWVQVKVLHVEGTAEKKTNCDFRVEYESSTELEFTTTDYKSVPPFFKARYADQSECSNNMTSQIALFEKATQLKPIFHYCTDYEHGSRSWGITLTALGKATLKPQVSSYIANSEPQDIKTTELIEGLKTSLKNHGALFADWIHQTQLLLGEVYVHYYAEKPISFVMEKVSSNASPEICSEQAREARSWLMALSSPPFTVHCQAARFGKSELTLGWLENSSVILSDSTESFASFDECQRQREETLSHYKGSVIYRLLGGVCSIRLDSPQYRLVIVRVKK